MLDRRVQLRTSVLSRGCQPGHTHSINADDINADDLGHRLFRSPTEPRRRPSTVRPPK